MDIVNALWIHKWRPKTLNDLILPDEYRQVFSKYIQRREIPNLIFHGPPGGGKTTLAKILVSRNGVINHPRDNVIEINGSSKESRGIAFIEDVIEPFLKIPPAGKDNYRVVYFDEGDNLTDASFKSLRGLIEKYMDHARFIFTCNYLSKIPDNIQSRHTLFEFKQIPVDDAKNHCKDILVKENIEFDEKNLQFVVTELYPDIRKIVDTLQRLSMSGKLIINKDIVYTKEKLIVSSILQIVICIETGEKHKLNKTITEVVNIIHEKDIDFRKVYETLFYSTGLPAPAKMVVNNAANKHNNCLIPSMHFMSMVFSIIKCLNEYKQKIQVQKAK